MPLFRKSPNMAKGNYDEATAMKLKDQAKI